MRTIALHVVATLGDVLDNVSFYAGGVENRLTRFYDHYVSLPSTDWFGRLLSPAWLLESLPLAAGSWVSLAEWSAGRLPVPVLHPGCSPNNETPIEVLLGIQTDELRAIAYGEDQRTLADLILLLSALELPSSDAPAPDHRSAHLRNLALHDARPEWMILLVLPLPPASLLTESAVAELSALQARVEKLSKLLGLEAPAMIIEGQSAILQDQVARFFDVMVESLHERL